MEDGGYVFEIVNDYFESTRAKHVTWRLYETGTDKKPWKYLTFDDDEKTQAVLNINRVRWDYSLNTTIVMEIKFSRKGVIYHQHFTRKPWNLSDMDNYLLRIERPVTSQVQDVAISKTTGRSAKNARSTEKMHLQFYEITDEQGMNLKPILDEPMTFQPIIRKTALKRTQPWAITGNIRIYAGGDIEYLEHPVLSTKKPGPSKKRKREEDSSDLEEIASSDSSFITDPIIATSPTEKVPEEVASSIVGNDVISLLGLGNVNMSKDELYSNIIMRLMGENENLRRELDKLRLQNVNMNRQWTLDFNSILFPEQLSYLDATDTEKRDSKKRKLLGDKDPLLNPGVEIFSMDTQPNANQDGVYPLGSEWSNTN